MIRITIKNWEKFFRPRKDVEHTTWLRLNNDIYRSPDLFHFTFEEKWVWISILCLASEKQTDTLEFEESWFCHFTKVSSAALTTALGKLSRNGCVTLTLRPRNAGVRERTATIRNVKGSNVKLSNETRSKEESGAKRAKESRAPEGVNELIATYVEAYKSKYGGRPEILAKDARFFSLVLKTVPLQRAKDLVQVFLQTDDPWFVKTKHRPDVFYGNLGQLGASLEAGKPLEATSGNLAALERWAAEGGSQ